MLLTFTTRASLKKDKLTTCSQRAVVCRCDEAGTWSTGLESVLCNAFCCAFLSQDDTYAYLLSHTCRISNFHRYRPFTRAIARGRRGSTSRVCRHVQQRCLPFLLVCSIASLEKYASNAWWPLCCNYSFNFSYECNIFRILNEIHRRGISIPIDSQGRISIKTPANLDWYILGLLIASVVVLV